MLGETRTPFLPVGQIKEKKEEEKEEEEMAFAPDRIKKQ